MKYLSILLLIFVSCSDVLEVIDLKDIEGIKSFRYVEVTTKYKPVRL